MLVKLRTLTPMWTGDSEGVSATLRETGLLGSLRWWYEGWLRAKGYRVCDPTSAPCSYDTETKLAKVCGACRLFGCTGWARLFRINGSGLKPAGWSVAAGSDVFSVHKGWLERIYMRRDKPKPAVLWGPEFELSFLPRFHKLTTPDVDGQVGALLRMIEAYGALGAKTQNGYGMIRIEDGAAPGRFATDEDLQRGEAAAGTFDLRKFFSMDFMVPDPGPYLKARRIGEAKTVYDSTVIPCAYDVRYKSKTSDWRTGAGKDVGLRPLLKEKFGKWGGDQLMGAAARSGEKRAGRVHVSHLYRSSGSQGYSLRIWGTVPSQVRERPENIAAAVEQFISGPGGMFRGSSVVRRSYWNDLERQ